MSFSTMNDARDAARSPNRPMPMTMTTAPTARLIAVTGKRSPYPTVVIVVMAHHSASGIDRILR